MIALSVRQPYANRIATGAKKRESRTWTTSHRGDLVIVSSRHGAEAGGPGPFGVTICLVELADIVRPRGDRIFQWILRNPRPLEPMVVKGQLGLYTVDDSLVLLPPEG